MKSAPGQLKFLQCWTAFSALALVAATFPLWFPQSNQASFPQIPLFSLFCTWPIAGDWSLSSLLLIGWTMIILGRCRSGGVIVLVCSGLLVCLNQHRLQPWHYHFSLFAAIFTLGAMTGQDRDRRQSAFEQLRAMRWLTISVYFYSALGKADFEFMHTVGQQFLDQILEFIHLKNAVPAVWKPVLAAGLPLFELVVAIGLMIPGFRRVAGICACILHLVLILILSPIGLHHSLGVLLWNVYFVVLAGFLFVVPSVLASGQPVSLEEGSKLRRSSMPFRYLVLLLPVLLLPATERLGYWDHWLSWALYAPHSSRVEISVATTAVKRLPAELQELLPTHAEEDLRVSLPIGTWSLNKLGAPVYPQARFQLGIAQFVAEQLDSEFAIRARILGTARRIDGKRDTVNLDGTLPIIQAGNAFRLNTRPRRVPR